MAQHRVVMTIPSMKDVKSRQKAIQAAIMDGVDEVSADINERKLTVIGTMDLEALKKRMEKKIGKVSASAGPS